MFDKRPTHNRMGLIIRGIFLFLFIHSTGYGLTGGGDPSKKAVGAIRAESARQHLMVLASDSLAGRSSPSRGLTGAGEYISAQFRKAGLEAVNGSYYHAFHLQKIALGPLDRFRLDFISPDGDTSSFSLKKDFVPYSESGSGMFMKEIVFAGYGVVDTSRLYNDYDGIDVRDKIVVIMNGIPRFAGEDVRKTWRTRFTIGRMSVKILNALERGATALVVINDFLHGRSLEPRGYPWPELNPLFSRAASPTIMPEPTDNKIPVLNAGEEVVRTLFGSVETLRRTLMAIDSLSIPQSHPVKGNLRIDCPITLDPVELRNIIGLYPGIDPVLKNEIVVIGAHYDHVGSKEVPEGEDGIYNGADDNASGTTGLIEIANAYGLNEIRPRRSILFIAFAAEEKGLLGSRAYVANPLFPIQQHAAMFNMDMIGRNNPDSLSVGGETHCPELIRINEEQNRKIGFTLAYNIEQYFFRSDQASFAKEKIPVIFYFTGEHEDYHKVTDEANKIDYDKLVRVARLCFLTSWQVANRDERLSCTARRND